MSHRATTQCWRSMSLRQAYCPTGSLRRPEEFRARGALITHPSCTPASVDSARYRLFAGWVREGLDALEGGADVPAGASHARIAASMSSDGRLHAVGTSGCTAAGPSACSMPMRVWPGASTGLVCKTVPFLDPDSLRWGRCTRLRRALPFDFQVARQEILNNGQYIMDDRT